MLRVKDMAALRDSEAYLYTVASNLAREHAARGRRRGTALDVENVTMPEQLAERPSFGVQIDAAQQAKRLREVLPQSPPKCHAAVVMHYVQGQSY